MRLLPTCVAGAMAAGVALGLTVPAPPAALCAAAIACLAFALVGIPRRAPHRVLAGAFGGLMLATWALCALDDSRARDSPLAAALRLPPPVELEGLLVSDAVPDGDSIRLRLAVSRLSGAPGAPVGDASLSVGGLQAKMMWPAWRAGRRVRTRATVHRPAVYRDEGVGDDRLAAARRGLVLVGSVKSGALVEVLDRGSVLTEAAASLRQFVRSAVARHVGGDDPLAAGITTAILIGDRTGLDSGLIDRLQAAGTYHVIAISGGNIAIFASTWLLLAWLLRIPARAANLSAIAAVWLYSGLVGGGSSVVRASAMATVYLGLQARDLRAPPICALAAAAAVMLAASPLSGVDAGFVLTFGATGAIVVLADRGLRLYPWPRFVRPAVAVIAASLATELVLLPVSALLFGRVTVAGPVLNLAAVPAMALVQQAGMAVVALDSWWPAAAHVAARLAIWGAWLLVRSADLIGWLPMLATRVPSPASWVIALYAVAGTLMLSARSLHVVPGRWRWRSGRAGAIGTVVAASWIVAHPATWRTPWRADGQLHVTSIDVGQGDSTLVRLPDATTVLVDTGGLGGDASFDIGSRVVAPSVWARHVGRLDALLLTHGDPDHIGGAPTVIDVFRPSVTWEGVVVHGHAPMAALRESARERGLAWQTLTDGAEWERGGVRFHVWNPPPADWERSKVRNDDSIVLELRYGDVSVVLPGDISRDVEQRLAGRLPAARLRVLKLAHHGSATSSSGPFLDALRPTVALVSCGRENRFGHPAPAVMARLAERRIPVFRTDAGGEIDVTTDGRMLSVRSVDQGP